jgi:hypothetical protein
MIFDQEASFAFTRSFVALSGCGIQGRLVVMGLILYPGRKTPKGYGQ